MTAQPSASPRLRVPIWLVLAGLALMAIAFIFFIRTGDPIVLVTGAFLVLALAFLWVATLFGGALLRYLSAGSREAVRVRCVACQGLNPEDARYCNACGKPV